MELRLDEKVAVVTGATSGIGRATAVALGAAGARVVVSGRREPQGEETVAQVERAGGEARFLAADVRDDAQVAALMDGAVLAFGRLDVVVNNAGMDLNVGVADATPDDWDSIMDTNARGVWSGTRHAIRVMREAGGGGTIVNTNSASGFVPTAAQGIYGTSKRAITHLTRAAAREVGKEAIRVNEIVPALLMSEMVRGYFEGPDAAPLEPVVERLALDHAGEPEDGAAAILFLCSDAASFITGASLPVDGGFLLYNAGAG